MIQLDLNLYGTIFHSNLLFSKHVLSHPILCSFKTIFLGKAAPLTQQLAHSSENLISADNLLFQHFGHGLKYQWHFKCQFARDVDICFCVIRCTLASTGLPPYQVLGSLGTTWGPPQSLKANIVPQTGWHSNIVLLLPCYIQDIRECWDIEENMWRLLPLLSLALALPVIPSDKSSVSSPSDNIRSFQMENLSFSRSYS